MIPLADGSDDLGLTHAARLASGRRQGIQHSILRRDDDEASGTIGRGRKRPLQAAFGKEPLLVELDAKEMRDGRADHGAPGAARDLAKDETTLGIPPELGVKGGIAW